MDNSSKGNMAAIFIVLAAMAGLLFTSASGQSASNNSSQNNQSINTNKSQGIGSAKELSQVLGNNSEILANNTAIGNPNASMAEKMSAESNSTGNQTSLGNQSSVNQSSANQSSANQSSANQSSVNQSSANQSNPLTNLAEGIGKALGIGKK
jgi:hypothetical protein